MKVLITINLLLLTSVFNFLIGQNYTDTVVFNKFIGHWRWTNDKDTFEIKLIKDTIPRQMINSKTYNIYGFHRLIEDGKVLENSFLDNKEIILSEATIVGTSLNDRTLNLIVIDKYRHKTYLINLELENANKINWKKTQDRERIRYITKAQRNNTPRPLSSKIIPIDITLSKVDN